MTQPSKPLAKSLHTVTVLTRLAIYLHQSGQPGSAWSLTGRAADILGHLDAPDPHALRMAAAKAVTKALAAEAPTYRVTGSDPETLQTVTYNDVDLEQARVVHQEMRTGGFTGVTLTREA